MVIKKVQLTNFRNYDYALVDFSEGISLVAGSNAQGKTNLVESLVLASTAKSPRTSNLQDLIKDGKQNAFVDVIIERNFGEVKISCSLNLKGEKKFYVNGNEVAKIGDIFGNMVVIYFCPNDLEIVSHSPQERRDFMDTDISQLSGAYYNLLQRYNKILSQRNRLLKIEKNREVLASQISVWNEQLASCASLIVKTRKGFIEKLKTPAKEAMQFISSAKDELEIAYIGAKGQTAEEIKREILSGLEYNFDRDIELGYTTIGPHRDDIYFGLNGKDARSFSSQGQQRSIVLALKLAEVEIFKNEMGESPTLVLDDVFSELDTTRQRRLYERMQSFQTIITGTTFRFKPATEYKQIVIKNGMLAERKKREE